MNLKRQRGEIGFIIWILAIIGAVWFVYTSDEQQELVRNGQKNKDVQAWNTYMQSSCKITKQLYGATYKSGKTTATFNGVTMDCADGVEYSLDRKTFELIPKCAKDAADCTKLPMSEVPAVPK